MDTLLHILAIGIGATAAIDLWAIARSRLFGVALPDYGLVGRWLAHMPRGRFRHDSIRSAAPVRGESALGWTAHYLTGVAFAGLLPAFWGSDWFRDPVPGPALLVGIATVAAPLLLMQPGMGAGIAASRLPRPNAARLQSLLTHAIFGLALFVAAWIIAALRSP